ncbi:MAG: Sll0314/Alr1548 family TPR repeat-containing protein [Pleurocapsa sp. MO_226.B13]|nr:Sll0314/Alr1548 family TPR repeat-containing protein [Pleurocapsa sp. MO_226.B13]
MTKKTQLNRFRTQFKQIVWTIPLSIAMIISLSNNSALAKDPFREENPRDIGKHTEKAFKTIFLEGDYKAVAEDLELAESEEADDPLAHAMLASLAYTENDWDSIKKYALKTLESAQILSETDPVRGNLYLAVGHFLDGAYIYEKQGALDAIDKLQLVFKFLDRAEDSDPSDPELNLIKGYMDLLLAVNLPFSKPEQAIARFETYAAPNYLVERGLAVAYRDLKQYNQALKYADKALKTAPENPEHYYLKGQILRQIGKKKNDIKTLEQAQENFALALEKSAQLPEFVLATLERENRLTQERIAEIKSGKEPN